MRLDRTQLDAALDPSPIVLDSTSSTNDALRTAAQQGAPHGTVVLTEHQTAGRGRLGRTWTSDPGVNLLLSLLVRQPVPTAKAPLLCLGAAVAVAHVAGPSFRIKWPNDVLAPDGRKVAGILAEAEWGESATLRYAILGIGLNVAQSPDLPTATHLGDVDGPRNRTTLAIEVVRQVLERVEQVQHAPADLLADWRARCVTLGRSVRVDGLQGTAVGIDPDGALRIRDPQGREHRIVAGDVEIVKRLV